MRTAADSGASQHPPPGLSSPAAHDRARNRHRDGRAWAKSAIKAILNNPRYTGHQVWNRQPRHEILRDVEDVADGYKTLQRWNDPSDWVWSAETTHEALVSPEDFARAQEQMRAGRNRPAVRKAHRAPHPYMLRGLLSCGVCGRRMGGHTIRAETRYRCRYPLEYSLANEVDHPRTVLVREDWIVEALDAWLLQLFEPDRIEETVAELAAAGGPTHADAASLDAAQRQLVDCDGRLAKYRAALEHGTDATVVGTWIAEVQGERLAAERKLAEAQPSPMMTAADFARIIEELGDLRPVLADADPVSRCPRSRCCPKYVSEGGLEPPRVLPH
jgi:site-specific DNA recombinase